MWKGKGGKNHCLSVSSVFVLVFVFLLWFSTNQCYYAIITTKCHHIYILWNQRLNGDREKNINKYKQPICVDITASLYFFLFFFPFCSFSSNAIGISFFYSVSDAEPKSVFSWIPFQGSFNFGSTAKQPNRLPTVEPKNIIVQFVNKKWKIRKKSTATKWISNAVIARKVEFDCGWKLTVSVFFELFHFQAKQVPRKYLKIVWVVSTSFGMYFDVKNFQSLELLAVATIRFWDLKAWKFKIEKKLFRSAAKRNFAFLLRNVCFR